MAWLTEIGFAAAWPYCLGTLSVLLLLSGADDLVPVLVCGLHWFAKQFRGNNLPHRPSLQHLSERRMAILVPCWRESEVIGNMVRHNLAAIRYGNFDFFLGVYPNDEATVRAAAELADSFPKVHVAICPNPGPTSKADCLNSAYERMRLYEREAGVRVDTVVLHDAEDLIHPQALATIDRERRRFDMVQVPVLPLATGWSDVTHGVYCDEFAEYQTIDMRARQLMKSFVPSNGVGTGFSRDVLDTLAGAASARVFDEESLTEDYEIGVRLHQAGYRQAFVPLQQDAGEFVATREFFPRTMRTAIRQRTRWVTGISLQCWERHGWRGSLLTRYWYWRDRKGLLANPLSVVANVLFVAGLFDYCACAAIRIPWHFTVQSHLVAWLCIFATSLQCVRLALRAACVRRIYGISTSMGVPLRSFHANLINTRASFHAVWNYLEARRQARKLAWYKTEHDYPSRELLHGHRRELKEVLLGGGYLSADQLRELEQVDREGATLDLLLLARGLMSEQELCKALSLQSGLATAQVHAAEVNPRVVRALPAALQKRCGVVPYAVHGGRMMLAASRIPDPSHLDELAGVNDLRMDVRLVTHTVYRTLEELL